MACKVPKEDNSFKVDCVRLNNSAKTKIKQSHLLHSAVLQEA